MLMSNFNHTRGARSISMKYFLLSSCNLIRKFSSNRFQYWLRIFFSLFQFRPPAWETEKNLFWYFFLEMYQAAAACSVIAELLPSVHDISQKTHMVKGMFFSSPSCSSQSLLQFLFLLPFHFFYFSIFFFLSSIRANERRVRQHLILFGSSYFNPIVCY